MLPTFRQLVIGWCAQPSPCTGAPADTAAARAGTTSSRTATSSPSPSRPSAPPTPTAHTPAPSAAAVHRQIPRVALFGLSTRFPWLVGVVGVVGAAAWVGGALAAAAGCRTAAQSPAARLAPRQLPRNVALHAPNNAGQKVTYVTFWPAFGQLAWLLCSTRQTRVLPTPVPRLAACTERWGGRRRRSGRAAAARARAAGHSGGAGQQPTPTARSDTAVPLCCTRYSGTLWRCAASGWRLGRRAPAARRGRAAAGHHGQRDGGDGGTSRRRAAERSGDNAAGCSLWPSRTCARAGGRAGRSGARQRLRTRCQPCAWGADRS